MALAIAVIFNATKAEDFAKDIAKARETPAPQGMVYMNYCDGRPSSALMKKNAGRHCLADYPGEFIRGTSTAFFILLFLGVNALYFLYIWISRWRAKRNGPSD